MLPLTFGPVRYEEVLQPVTGRAVPVMQGEVLTITLIEGPQCVDFNCFNLHDYKERLSVGHMRRYGGFRVNPGSVLWSAPPRFNPLMVLLDKPDTCVTDILGARCNAVTFERERGYPGLHTNCQDCQAEAIGEFGLSPDDVHDSLNFWMNTGWDDSGTFIPNVKRNKGRKGDTVTLLATMDVLAVPNVCGSGDVSNTSNYFFRPIQIRVMERSADTERLTAALRRRYTGFRNQRTVADFRISDIKTDRALKRNPDYKPSFVNHPLRIEEFRIPMSASDLHAVKRLVARGLADDPEDAIRSGAMTWYTKNRTVQTLPEALDFDFEAILQAPVSDREPDPA
jgi:uncharacterized protein YcgI (DUF1989 family)